MKFDLPGAEREFLTAIELNPNSAYAHLFYSNCYLMPMGRSSEGIAENKKALELDPLSLPINNFMGMTYMFAGEYEKSYQQFQRTVAMDPTFPLAHDYFSGLLVAMGRYEEAIKESQKAELLSGSTPEDATAKASARLKAYKTGGDKGFWQENLERDLKTMERSGGRYFAASVIAADYALVGEKDKAFEWPEKPTNSGKGLTNLPNRIIRRPTLSPFSPSARRACRRDAFRPLRHPMPATLVVMSLAALPH